MQICPNCHQVFDGSKCVDCIARKARIDKALGLCFPLAFIGVFWLQIDSSLYPPLGPNSLMVSLIPVVSLSVGLGLAILYSGIGKRIVRYSRLVIPLIISIAIACLISGGYFFLNGILDGKPALEVQSHVISKYISIGRGGGPDVLVNLSWNQQTVEEKFRVDRRTYSEAEPGDSVRLLVHPGAFSTPWYGSVDFGHNATDYAAVPHPAPSSGAWLQDSIIWRDAPRDINPQLQSGEVTVLYFGKDQRFALIYGIVGRVRNDYMTISHGDPRGVFLGKWQVNGEEIDLEYRLMDRTIRVTGETLPGPIEKATIKTFDGTLAFRGKTFRRATGLDQSVAEVLAGLDVRQGP